jgi:ketosteroid isomerase-like protein
MSQENVEIARRLHVEFNRTFNEGKADLFDHLDPDVEWIPMTSVLEGIHFRGHDGVRQWLEDMKRDWEVFETRPVEFHDLGDDRVLSLGTWRAIGRGSGVELSFEQAAWLGHYRDGKLFRLETFTERERAFEAAGVDEPA